MARDASCTVIGNLSRDPELRYAATGTAVCTFGVAVGERKFDKDSNTWVDGETSFFDCTAFGQLAENIAESLQKGNRAIVSGSLKLDQWLDKDSGAKRSKVGIIVDSAGPDLKWATAAVVRNERKETTREPSTPPVKDNPFGD